MADPIEPDARGPQAPEPSRKAAPDTLTLRAAPRRVVRLRRGVIIGGAAAGAFAIAGVAWMVRVPKPVGIVSGADGTADQTGSLSWREDVCWECKKMVVCRTKT